MPPKLLLKLLADIYDKIDALGVSPVLAGGLAVSFWGHPRSTQGIDLAILIENIQHFEDQLDELGLKPAKSRRLIDLADIRTLCQIHRDQLDIRYLESKSQELKLPLGFWNS